MDVTSPTGIASAWLAVKTDATQQAVQLSMLKQQAEVERSLGQLVEQAVEERAPPAPEGQGGQVDIRI
jgi:hypothetical protein